uniref:NADH-ubiquinone oxidoreductase chain 3 n=1 Tax=Coniothyrium glycines TaxID=1077358 RepID=A0A3G4S6S8_9PLEO|nr:NADH dehydrogenase subunit 3 [Coniothyrium glycines]AYU74405.1 NADH dehydrogenase subunit 3 [Coniothyrium glycines]
MTNTSFFILFVPILATLLLAINLILAPHNPYQEKNSPFECGYHSFLGQNRIQFSVSFFIFGLLFLLFDLEILLAYPYSVSSYTNDIYGLVIFAVFCVLLALGFVFELGKNALTIDSKQTSSDKSSDESSDKSSDDKKNTTTPLANLIDNLTMSKPWTGRDSDSSMPNRDSDSSIPSEEVPSSGSSSSSETFEESEAREEVELYQEWRANLDDVRDIAVRADRGEALSEADRERWDNVRQDPDGEEGESTLGEPGMASYNSERQRLNDRIEHYEQVIRGERDITPVPGNPGGPSVPANYVDPSRTQAGPSTSQAGPSTSQAGPSTSQAGPSTSQDTNMSGTSQDGYASDTSQDADVSDTNQSSDDSDSDSDTNMDEYLPIIFTTEIGITRIISVIYYLYKIRFFFMVKIWLSCYIKNWR